MPSACSRILLTHSGMLQFSSTTIISVPIKLPAVSSGYFIKSMMEPACSTSSTWESTSSWSSLSSSWIRSTASSVSRCSTKSFAMSLFGMFSSKRWRSSSSSSINVSAAVSLSKCDTTYSASSSSMFLMSSAMSAG